MIGNIITCLSLVSFYNNFSENRISDSEINEELNWKIKLFEQKMNLA